MNQRESADTRTDATDTPGPSLPATPVDTAAPHAVLGSPAIRRTVVEHANSSPDHADEAPADDPARLEP